MGDLVSFAAWVSPVLQLDGLGGRTYRVRPPSVGRAKQLLALAVKSEIGLGLAPGPLPESLAAVCEAIAGEAFAPVPLGQDVYDQMVEDGVPALDIDRAAYYALHYWARGKAQADAIAELMWGGESSPDEGAPVGKARRGSRSGRRTASASPTPTASTPTTGSRQS